VFTRASNARSADPRALVERGTALCSTTDAVAVDDPAAALETALEASPRVIVAGSIFLLGDVLPLVEARDTLRNSQ